MTQPVGRVDMDRLMFPAPGSRKDRKPGYSKLRNCCIVATLAMASLAAVSYTAGWYIFMLSNLFMVGVFLFVALVNEVDKRSFQARRRRLRESKEYDSLYLCLVGECEPWECDYGCYE